MADNNSNPINRTHIYSFRASDGAGNGPSLTTIPLVNSVPSAHQLTRDVTNGTGRPTRELLSDTTDASLDGLGKGVDQLKQHSPNLSGPLGNVGRGLNVVGAVNDGVNITQHWMADRYREAGIELGGALGQSAGAASGAAIVNAAALSLNAYPAARIIGIGLGAFGGSRTLGEAGKDAVRHFTAPSLPDDLDLTPHLIRNGAEYVMVEVAPGQIQWYRINRPDPVDYADQVAVAGDPLAEEPSTATTYTPITSPRYAGQITDAYLRQELAPEAYAAYVAERSTLENANRLLQDGEVHNIDGEWVRVTPTYEHPDFPSAELEYEPLSPEEAKTLNDADAIRASVRARSEPLLRVVANDGNTEGVHTTTLSSGEPVTYRFDASGHLLGGEVRTHDGAIHRFDGTGTIIKSDYTTSNQPRPTRDFDAPETPDSYTVQEGDTLWGVAERYGVPYEVLRDANRQITHPGLIHPGQRVNIPGLAAQRELEGLLESGAQGVYDSGLPQANTPPVSPSPRLDENGMPLPEIRDGAAYDPDSDPVYQTLVTAFRDAQAADQSIPTDAVQVADAGTTMNDAGQGYGPADPNAPVDGIASTPNAPHGGGAAPDLAAGVNTGADAGTPTWYSGSNQTANSYAQGVQSAVSFIQALQQGNEFSAGLSGMSMLNAFARASGVKPEALPFDQTYTSGLGAVSAALNLRDALKADDNFGALVAGTNMAAQIGQTYIYATNSLVASGEMSLAQASPVVNGLGQVAGVLGIANSLRQGDELGAAIGAVMMFNPVLGIGLSIARALFGGDDPPEPRGTAEVRWGADGSLSVAVTEDDDGGGQSAQGMMQSMLDTLNGYLGQQTETANATSLSRGPRLDPIGDAHGDPSFALIPQRLPTVSFFQREYAEFMLNYTDDHGNRITRHYNAQGQRLGLDGNIESTFAEDFLNEVASHNALVPKWEADTVRQRMDHGDSNAWKDETADATSLSRGPRLGPIGETLPTPEDVKGGLLPGRTLYMCRSLPYRSGLPLRLAA